ncbi:DNase I-like protein [Sistotremastrum niveocremeum HHB9708]|uniref:DNA-(apurinic or apyrimidinic site) endonuclease n=1 Tax=Sistotremastrum niveocremeum HHB9708 TaxID=1314777 RepID=A0A164VW01_9AGAM|nr:DNase I-like protein [Sistotremastrum niveocremeum HHB9708]
MRILTWNINGIRTLPQYYPWNTLKKTSAILEGLQADIICFQEMKTTRPQLTRDIAVPDPYHAFLSFPATKGGYSGVAVYTTVIPLKAEEGLTGKLQPKPPLTSEERISPSYPAADDINLVPDEKGMVPVDFEALEAEGRALVLDFGLFVLINLYCPNEGSEERLPYKVNYHLMLEERVRKLLEDEKREVIVVGDINITAAPIDHCDGALESRASEFWEHPARAWFRKWLSPQGPMIDVVRHQWPDRKGMYTCWNTKISARETNYGTRIDYILLTRGMMPWFKGGDIQPSVKGSDHCPVYIDLHDQIELESGQTLLLRDALKQDTAKDPPRLCTKYWDEFSNSQKLLSNFFGRRSESVPLSQTPVPLLSSSLVPLAEQSSQISTKIESSASIDKQPSPAIPKEEQIQGVKKRKQPNPPSKPSPKAPKKARVGQSKISTFFSQPKLGASVSETIIIDQDDESLDSQPTSAPTSSQEVPGDPNHSPLDLDNLSQFSAFIANESTTSSKSKAQWSQLMAPVQPPKCDVHGEPCKQYTVNKPGPNKGKTFWLCSRPVGTGYDAGRSKRLREEVNPQYRCNFFKWSSDVKRAALRNVRSSQSEG